LIKLLTKNATAVLSNNAPNIHGIIR